VPAAQPAGATGPDVEAIRQRNLDIQQILADLQAGKITAEVAAQQILAREPALGTTSTGAPTFTAPPVTGDTTTATVDPTVSAGMDAYEKIWGVTPPKGYIESLVKQGLNVFQIELHELSQPGASRTKYWRDTEASVAAQVAQLMGRR